MSQDEPFRQLAQNFRQHATDENEKLKARYESTDDTWHFDGSHLSERTFKALAREGRLETPRGARPNAVIAEAHTVSTSAPPARPMPKAPLSLWSSRRLLMAGCVTFLVVMLTFIAVMGRF